MTPPFHNVGYSRPRSYVLFLIHSCSYFYPNLLYYESRVPNTLYNDILNFKSPWNRWYTIISCSIWCILDNRVLKIRPDQINFVVARICRSNFPYSGKISNAHAQLATLYPIPCALTLIVAVEGSPVYPRPEWGLLSSFKDFLHSTTHHVR